MVIDIRSDNTVEIHQVAHYSNLSSPRIYLVEFKEKLLVVLQSTLHVSNGTYRLIPRLFRVFEIEVSDNTWTEVMSLITEQYL